MKIAISIDIAAPPAVVWDNICDITTHTDWMRDALDVELIGHQTQGVGTRFACETKVGPMQVTDTMEITEWSPGQKMGVRHTGIVSGEGIFSIQATGQNVIPQDATTQDADTQDATSQDAASQDAAHTRFQWSETLRFPWRLGGPVGEFLAYPVLRSMWKGNLKRLKQKIESNNS